VTDQPITCPSCRGKKTSLWHINRGSGPHTWEHRTCTTCTGTGIITPEHAGRITEGERRREDRKSRLLSLRQEATRLGISARELSDIENGRI